MSILYGVKDVRCVNIRCILFSPPATFVKALTVESSCNYAMPPDLIFTFSLTEISFF